MATVVNPPSGIQWSCKVLDLIISAGDHVNIAIDVDGTVILRVTLYTYNGTTRLVELAELVEQYMFDTGGFLCEVTVYEVDDDDPTDLTQLCQFQVLYCYANINTTPENFLRKNFISTAHLKRLEPGVPEKLFFYDVDAANDTLRMQVGYMEGDKMRVATVDNANSLIHTDFVNVNIDDIAELADVDNVVMATFTLGVRQMMYCTKSIPADAVFRFHNMFNKPEWLPLNCVTNDKQIGERTVVKVRRDIVLATVNHEVEHDVETAPLSKDEALLVTQLCESHDVKILKGVLRDITIIDRTCEISDEHGQLPTAKFSWQYLDGKQYTSIHNVEDDGIFSDEFDPNYD